MQQAQDAAFIEEVSVHLDTTFEPLADAESAEPLPGAMPAEPPIRATSTPAR
jgi:hypothetical protein